MMNCITKPPFVTGKMAATYIARQYGNKSFTWALAGSRGRELRACIYYTVYVLMLACMYVCMYALGRRGQALNALRDELAKIDPDLSTLATIVVDSNDEGCHHIRVCMYVCSYVCMKYIYDCIHL